MAQFTMLVADGNATIRLETDSASPNACDGMPWVDFLMTFTGPPIVMDVNSNGIPDECEFARGDNNLDGVVDVQDLLILLAHFEV